MTEAAKAPKRRPGGGSLRAAQARGTGRGVMVCYNSRFRVELVPDPCYTIGSADNRPYDRVFNPEELGGGDYRKVCRLAVEDFQTGEETQAALIGAGTWCVEGCAVLNGAVLTVLMDRRALQLSLDPFEQLDSKKISADGPLLALYPWGEDFLVHGELEVLRLDRRLRVLWSFSGRDIFVTRGGGKAFEMEQGRIRLRDWEGNRYELDPDGKLLSELPASRERVLVIDVTEAASPTALQRILKQSLGMPDWYGMNWDAFWDGITGLIRLPDTLVFEGWHLYKARCPEDARVLERLMEAYGREAGSSCQVIYRYFR